jgi:hypothetical protein
MDAPLLGSEELHPVFGALCISENSNTGAEVVLLLSNKYAYIGANDGAAWSTALSKKSDKTLHVNIFIFLLKKVNR